MIGGPAERVGVVGVGVRPTLASPPRREALAAQARLRGFGARARAAIAWKGPMAKWGEGDERWIVAERNDGTNINGWHWTEKSIMTWCKDRLEGLCAGIQPAAPEDNISASIVGIKELTGEASVTTRKGNKKFAVYDLTVVLKWQGRVVSPSATEDAVEGTIKVTELAEGNDADDYTFAVTVEGKGKAQDTLKRAMATTKKAVYEKLEEFVEQMKREHC